MSWKICFKKSKISENFYEYFSMRHFRLCPNFYFFEKIALRSRGGFFVGFPIPQEKIPIPWDFLKKSEIKIPKIPGFGIWDLGFQKNPIPKPPLLRR